MKNLNILVTGGGGYIGSVLVTKLIDLNHKVTVIDKMIFNKTSLNHLIHKNNIKIITGDVNNSKLLKKNLKNKDFIIPLAAIVGASLCEKNKKEAINTNLKAVEKICKFSKKNQKIIYLNTNSGYGVKKKEKVYDENSELLPNSLYGKTKNEAEKVIKKRSNYLTFRLASVFGFSFRMREELLLHFMVREAFTKKSIKLFEPNFKRNFVHISDVCKAIIFGIENFDKMKNEAYNLGLFKGTITKLELVKKIKKRIKNLKVKIIKSRSDPDSRDYVVSNTKLERKGFKATFSLDNGIKEYLKILEI